MGRQDVRRVLRVGLIRDGRIVLERLVPHGAPVTVSASGGATVPLVETDDAPADGRLLVWDGTRYQLQVTAGMRGRLREGDRMLSLDAVREGTDDAGSWQVAIGPGVRGSVRLGASTLLFQTIAAPPPEAVVGVAPTRSYRPKWVDAGDDLLYGSLGVWTALAVVLVVWVITAPVPEITTMQELPPYIAAAVYRPAPPPEPVATVDVVLPDAVDPPRRAPQEPPPPPASKEARLESFTNLLIGTTGRKGRKDLTAGSSMETDVDRLMQVSREPGALETRSRTATDPIEGDRRIGDVTAGKAGRSTIEDVPKASVRLPPPPKDARPDATSGWAHVFVGRSGRFRMCYERALKRDSTLTGRIVLAWELGGGKVVDAWTEDNATGSTSLATCLAEAVMKLDFSGVADGQARQPMVFEPTR